jgi:hypothetical protein
MSMNSEPLQAAAQLLGEPQVKIRPTPARRRKQSRISTITPELVELVRGPLTLDEAWEVFRTGFAAWRALANASKIKWPLGTAAAAVMSLSSGDPRTVPFWKEFARSEATWGWPAYLRQLPVFDPRLLRAPTTLAEVALLVTEEYANNQSAPRKYLPENATKRYCLERLKKASLSRTRMSVMYARLTGSPVFCTNPSDSALTGFKLKKACKPRGHGLNQSRANYQQYMRGRFRIFPGTTQSGGTTSLCVPMSLFTLAKAQLGLDFTRELVHRVLFSYNKDVTEFSLSEQARFELMHQILKARHTLH